MTSTSDKIKVMQAFEEGKEIEYAAKSVTSADKWRPVTAPAWDWNVCIYRVKPEPAEFYAVVYTYNDGVERYSPLWLDKEKAEGQALAYLATERMTARVIKLREVLDES